VIHATRCAHLAPASKIFGERVAHSFIARTHKPVDGDALLNVV
jgi:hypothetical protein